MAVAAVMYFKRMTAYNAYEEVRKRRRSVSVTGENWELLLALQSVMDRIPQPSLTSVVSKARPVQFVPRAALAAANTPTPVATSGSSNEQPDRKDDEMEDDHEKDDQAAANTLADPTSTASKEDEKMMISQLPDLDITDQHLISEVYIENQLDELLMEYPMVMHLEYILLPSPKEDYLYYLSIFKK